MQVPDPEIARQVAQLAEVVRRQGETLARQQEELGRLRRENEELRGRVATLETRDRPDTRKDTDAEKRLKAVETQVGAVCRMMGSVVDQIEALGEPRSSDDRFEELDRDMSFLTRIVERLAVDAGSGAEPAPPRPEPAERIRAANVEDQLRFMRSQVQASGLLQEQ